MGQHDLGDLPDDAGFVFDEPGQLRDGEGRNRHRADPLGPGFGSNSTAETISLGGRLGVVPEFGGTERPIICVKNNEPVLLSPNPDRGDVARMFGDLCERLHERSPPTRRVLLTSGWIGRRVCASTNGDDDSRVQVAHLDLA